MITGLSAASFKNLQLNAGVFLKNFEFTSATTAASLKTLVAAAIKDKTKCLGATRGGGNFSAVPTTREVEADGKRMPFVGSTHIDEWDIHLSTTLIEVTPDNLKISLGAASAVKTGSVTKISLNADFNDNDYISKVCWVGDTSEGFALIEIENALSTGGLNFTFTDKNENTIPIDLKAHMANLETPETMPAHVYIFEGLAVSGKGEET